MATTTESKKMIKLYSSDGEEFEIEESVAKKFRTNSKKPKVIKLYSSDGFSFVIEKSVFVESQTIKHMFEDNRRKSQIYLQRVDGEVLSKVVEYLVKHADSSYKFDEETTDEELKAWDAEFLRVNKGELYELIIAAADLGIDSLGNLVANAPVQADA